MRYEVQSVYKPFLFFLDLVSNIVFFWTKFFSVPENPKKILVLRFDHAGDMLMTTPVFRALKNKFPNAELVVLCRPFVRSLIETNKSVDNIYTLEVPWFKRDNSVSWLQTIKFLLNLRKQKFDLVFEFHADPRNIFSAFLIGGYRIGYAVRGFGFLLNKVVHYSGGKKHVIERNLDIVRSVGADSGSALDLLLRTADKQAVVNLLTKNKIKNFVLLYPVAGRPEKYWAVDSWAELCSALIEKYGFDVVFGGGVDDYEYVSRILNKVNEKFAKKVHNLCEFINTFRKLGALVDKSGLVVSTDTVIVHLASALNKPLVALYGPTDPDVWGYTGARAISVYKKLADGCGIDCRIEAHRMSMMAQISANDVLSFVDRILKH